MYDFDPFSPQLFRKVADRDDFNQTCSNFSTCSQCIGTWSEKDPDMVCVWCTARHANLTIIGCVQQKHAPSICQGPTQSTCNPPAYASYLMVLASASIICCCCGLFALRKVLAHWTVRRLWGRLGRYESEIDIENNDLVRPLLDEEMGSSHEAVFRATYRELQTGKKIWRCKVCYFENRPRSSYCDLCGTANQTTKEVAIKKEDYDSHSEGDIIDENDSLSNQANSLFDVSMKHGTSLCALENRKLFYLTQRQKAARRRRLWQRKTDESGLTIWTRIPNWGMHLPAVDPIDYMPTPPYRATVGNINTNEQQTMLPGSRDSIEEVVSSEKKTIKEQEDIESDFRDTIKKSDRISDAYEDDAMQSKSPGYFSTILAGQRMKWSIAGPGVKASLAIVGEDGGGPRKLGSHSLIEADWLRDLRENQETLVEVSLNPFWQKHVWLLDQLRILQLPHGAGMEAMRIEVRRDHLLEDSFTQVMSMKTGELRRWLRVQFVGEQGIDAGGIEREWFMLVTEALFDPQAGLFVANAESGTFDINPASGVASEMHLDYFKFTGRILGNLLLEQSVVPFRLSVPLLKHLLGAPISFSDLELVDTELFRHLNWLKTHSANSLGLFFTVASEHFGVCEIHELVKGGSKVEVTDENKEEYLRLMLQHRVMGRIESQLWHLVCGLFEVVPPQLISVFDYSELDHLLSGIQEIDVEDWKQNTTYHGEYRRLGEKHQVISWFWHIVQEVFSGEERSRLLQFVSGSSSVPPHGFKALQSNDGQFRRFSICSVNKTETLYPRAHTCFNKLDLPVYDSKKELEECLTTSIAFAYTGFDID